MKSGLWSTVAAFVLLLLAGLDSGPAFMGALMVLALFGAAWVVRGIGAQAGMRDPRQGPAEQTPELPAVGEAAEGPLVSMEFRFDPSAPGIDPAAALEQARVLVGQGDRLGALEELRKQLKLAASEVERDFGHCTAAEKRSLLAMRRRELFGLCARAEPAGGAARQAYMLIAYAWWIVGLALSGDRGEELRRARTELRWFAATDGGEVPADLLKWAVAHRPLATLADAEAFSAEVWERLRLAQESRVRT